MRGLGASLAAGGRGELGCRAPRTPWLIPGSQQSLDSRGRYWVRLRGAGSQDRAPTCLLFVPPPPSSRSPQHLQIQRTLGLQGTQHRGRGARAGSLRTRVQVPAQPKLRRGAGLTGRGLGFRVCSGEASTWGRRTGPAPSAHRTAHPGACGPGNATGPQGGGFPCTRVSTHPGGQCVCLPLPELSAPPPWGHQPAPCPVQASGCPAGKAGTLRCPLDQLIRTQRVQGLGAGLPAPPPPKYPGFLPN